MLKRINALKEARAAVIADARKILDKAEVEKREMTGEEKQEWEKRHADAELKGKEIATLEKQLEAERSVTLPETIQEPAKPETREEREKRAFTKYLRHGLAEMTLEERDSMRHVSARDLTTATSGSYGGYTVPIGLAADFEKAMLDFGGMLQAATILRTASGNTMYMPTAIDTGNSASRLDEATQNTGTTAPVFGRVQLDSYMYVTDIVKVSEQLARDSAYDIAGYLNQALGERLGRGLNAAFTTGDGSGDPNGIVTASTAGVTAAAQAALTADELIDLVHTIDPAYRRLGCVWMFEDATLKAIRKLKDGQGNYLWQPGIRTDVPDTIYGYPYIINQDMATIATSAKPILFGLLKKYIVRLVAAPAIYKFSEKYMDYLEVGYMGFQAADGDLLDAGTNPVKRITMSS